MPKYLIVYYTRTGHTGQVAKAVAERLGADLELIRESRSRLGWWGYWRSGRESFLGILPKIEPPQHDPGEYDVIVLGSPVWAGRPSTPMRAWLAGNREKLKSVACFCTLGGAGAKRTLDMMAQAAGKPAVATFSATERQLKSGDWKADMERFAAEIATAQA